MVTLDIIFKLGLHQRFEDRRRILAIGLAFALSGCAHHLLPSAQMPDVDDNTRSYPITYLNPLVERISRIGKKLVTAPALKRRWDFGVLPSEIPSAAAIRGSGIVLSVGMVKLCENDGQIGALLVWASKMPLQPANGRTDQSQVPDLAVIQAADLAAVRALAGNGYDPRDALVILKRAAQGSSERNVSAQMPRWASMENALRALGYQV